MSDRKIIKIETRCDMIHSWKTFYIAAYSIEQAVTYLQEHFSDFKPESIDLLSDSESIIVPVGSDE